jgi:cyclopropane fatty-acyl-phospholipid synthase-like methyltransferase
MQDYDKYKEKNNTFFDKLISESADEHLAVGQSKISHEKRFLKMLDSGDLHNKNLLDVGCGLGAFYSFLKLKNISVNYTGYDINEKMLQGARDGHPEIADKFKNVDIIENVIENQFDYSISVGPLNLNMDEKTNYEMTFKLLDSLFKCSKIGFALSMTSVMSRKKNNDTFYYDPTLIVNHISKYCNNYRIDHSYLPHDFTIFCYKDDFYSSF